jgi:uncharacterized protein (TIGR02186 family)
MSAGRILVVAGTLVACLVTRAARAEQLVLIPSTTTVSITSNYAGASVVLFGAVTGWPQEDPNYDAVITVTGPRQTLVARRKHRILGIWVNADSRTFADVPSYLAVLSNRQTSSIAAPFNLSRNKIGLERALASAPRTDGDTPFRTALIEIESEHGVFAEKIDAITFFSPTVFRAEIALPAHALVGTYDIDVKLFSKGDLVAHSLSAFEVVKTGVVQFIATAARNYGLLYGFAVTLMALSLGWIASVVFQRE